MKKIEKKNLAMLAGSSVVLAAVNAALLVAARRGMIEPVANFPLWGAFVLLNIASVVWATALLGLQPMVVSLSYAVGGFLAYSGVRGMPGIHVAEVASAGATYGAFGALAVGNATARVRLAFFRKGQVPFVFIMAGLLVVDAALNSRVSQAGAGVMLNAVVFPFLLAGVVVGLAWTLLNRFGIGHRPDALRAENRSADAEAGAAEPEAAKLVFRVPEEPVAAEPEPLAAVAAAAQAVPHKPLAKPLAAEVQAVDGIDDADDEFFPLEIDKHDAFDIGDGDASLLDFAAMLEGNAGEGALGGESPCETVPFGSGSFDRDGSGGTAVLEKPPAARTAKQDAKVAGRSGAARPEAAKTAKKDDDWLSGHLDLLNRLK